MSRSGYSDALENWDLIRWRGAVNSAIRGNRGQKFFKDLLAALEAMPEKRLITNELEHEGEFCALGALGNARGIDMAALDPEHPEQIAKAFNIAPALAKEVFFMNDEYVCWLSEGTPEQRWKEMRAWVVDSIKDAA